MLLSDASNSRNTTHSTTIYPPTIDTNNNYNNNHPETQLTVFSQKHDDRSITTTNNLKKNETDAVPKSLSSLQHDRTPSKTESIATTVATDLGKAVENYASVMGIGTHNSRPVSRGDTMFLDDIDNEVQAKK